MELFQMEIPKYLENLNLPDPSLLTLYHNFDKRIIWMDTEVDDTYIEYVKKIVEWNAEDKDKPEEERTPIKLFIFTPGGDLDILNMLLDVIRLSKTKIIGVNFGIALSAGAFLYLACHERLALPGSTFLFHSGSAEGISGTAEQISAYNEQYKKQVKRLKDYLIEMGLPKKLVDTKMKGEWFFNAKEAVDLGVCHKIVTSLDEVL